MENTSSSERRYASPNERRQITREQLDWYRSLYVGGIYQVQDAAADLSSKSTFVPGLQKCINAHPSLSIIVKDADTEKPYYVSCPITNPEDHVEILPTATEANPVLAVESVAEHIVDTKPTTSIPGWRIVVLPLKADWEATSQQCYVAFAYSHGPWDGLSALAFHKAFLAGLQEGKTTAGAGTPPEGAMPPPFDTKKTLPISWSFLLAPALGIYLPRWLGHLLGFRPAASTITENTYLGNRIFYDAANHATGARVLSVPAETLQKVLAACKSHNVKFTALLHQIVVIALSRSLPESLSNVDNFGSQTAIEMRSTVNVSKEQMGTFVSGFFHIHPRTSSAEDIWDTARPMGLKMHAEARSLQDQPIGLLRYLWSMRNWYLGKLGQKRDVSYEISNLLAYDPGAESPGKGNWEVGNMFFAQPANVTGPPLNFSIASRKGGDLTCTINWQIGALGVGDREAEYAFVEKVRGETEGLFGEVAASE